MQKQNIAVLLTCHNRRTKTIACLSSFFKATIPPEYELDIFLTDDGSTDGTGEVVNELFPQVKVLKGDGNLFWAGGMRLAWEAAMREKSYDAYLLINDDVVLYPGFFIHLLETEAYSLAETGKKGIYSGATVNDEGKVSYGASVITKNHFIMTSKKLVPASHPQRCDLTNANVLWISGSVVDEIGIFSEKYTHGIADFDYSLQAIKKDIPVWLTSSACGICNYDHGKKWKSSDTPLKQRIAWMKSPTGLAYKEYMYFIKKHFPLYLPYSFVMLWMKMFFPFIWDRYKK